jgi:hypothetical protein
MLKKDFTLQQQISHAEENEGFWNREDNVKLVRSSLVGNWRS